MAYTSIDYLQYSCEPYEIAVDEMFSKHSGRFYNEVATGYYGEKIYRGNPNSIKWLVIASGKICEQMQSDLSPRAICEDMLERGMNCTRIDVQATVSSASRYFATVSDVLNACKDRRYETTLGDSSPKFIGRIDDVSYNSQGIETLYMGNMKKRSKTGLFRAYDKGLESGLQADFLTRFECEFRRESAHSQVKRIANGWHLTEVMDNRVHFDTVWWYAAMDNHTSDGKEIRRGIAAKKNEDDVIANAEYWKWANMIAKSIGKRMAGEDIEKIPQLYRDLINSMNDGYNEAVRRMG